MASRKGALLEVETLSLHGIVPALFSPLSFTLSPGELLIILGPNGAGKTLLLQTLIGLRSHSGRIHWSPGVRKGYMPQRFQPSGDLPLNVQDFFNLKRTVKIDPVRTLDQVELNADQLLRKSLMELSRGEMQRVLLAWVLSGAPEVLLLDEPSSGVDFSGEVAFRRILKQEREERGAGVILVTHDLSLAASLGDRILSLGPQGTRYGSPEEVLPRRDRS